MIKYFSCCMVCLILFYNQIQASELKAKLYKLNAVINFSTNEKFETTIFSQYPTLEETHCTDEKIVFNLSLEKNQKIKKPEVFISGSTNFLDEVQAALKKFKIDEKYYNKSGTMTIYYQILKDPVAKSIYKKSEELFENGHYQAAYDILNTLKPEQANYICVLITKGNALTQLEKYQESLKYYDKAIEISPLSDRAYYARGWRKYKLEKYDAAIIDVKQSMEIQEFWEDYYLLNQIYNLKEDYLPAIKYATLGFKFRKGSYFYNRRGWSYIYNENFRLAAHDFDEIIKTNPESDKGYIGKSQALLKLKDYKQALQNINKAIEISGENEDLLFSKAYIYDENKDFEKSMQVYKKIINNYPAQGNTYNNLGWILVRLNKLDDAIEVFLYAIEHGYKSNLIVNLATTYHLNKQYSLSNKFFNLQIKNSASNDLSFEKAGLARNYIQQNKLDKAFKALQYVVANNPNYEDAYYEFKHDKGNYLKDIFNEFETQANTNQNIDLLNAIHQLQKKVAQK